MEKIVWEQFVGPLGRIKIALSLCWFNPRENFKNLRAEIRRMIFRRKFGLVCAWC